MLTKIGTAFFGNKHERDIRRLKPIIEKINSLEKDMQCLADAELAKKVCKLKSDLANGRKENEVLPYCFALVREASVRSLGLRLFDVQLMGAIVLHQGKIAEMKTGEGKTLTATAAVCYNTLADSGVHLVTINDYLAKRDAEWMMPVYEMLGLSVGIIQTNMSPDARSKAYQSDITYGTNNEFGFDFLRDNMVTDITHRVQRGHYFAIVDEVDSILIDEARTPLIISGAGQERTAEYLHVNQIIERFISKTKTAPPPPEIEVMPGKEEPHIIRGYYFDIDEKGRNVFLSEEGVKYLEKALKIENLYAPNYANLIVLIQQCLKANLIYKREVDYVVQNGEVIIVDEHTGRTLMGRRYGEGLHQAIEAKERVTIRQESQSLASITFQNYFRFYKKLSGMTGTAETEAEEFRKIYGLDVVAIPTHRPMIRKDHPDRVYATEKAKFKAIVADVRESVKNKQPVLLGTISIEKSELLSRMLSKENIPHSVLNAKHHSREAEIIANAGGASRVTVATNMAGRGTDIVLGASPQYLNQLDMFIQETQSKFLISTNQKDAKHISLESQVVDAIQNIRSALLKKNLSDARELLQKNKTVFQQLDSKIFKKIEVTFNNADAWFKNHELVKKSGGLYIIGTERHDARRIDNQLRGRSGRQGDPGASRFYLSLEDHLMRIFGGERIRNLMGKIGMDASQELEARLVDRAIARAQKRVENHHFDIRKHLLEYDEVMNMQREFVYLERNRLLKEGVVRKYLLKWMEDAFEIMILRHCPGLEMENWDFAGLREWLDKGLRLPSQILNTIGYEFVKKAGSNPQKQLLEMVFSQARDFYLQKVKFYEQEQGFPDFSYVERRIALDVLDNHWKDHLRMIDYLREGVWASGYAERNPLVEFKLEGFRLFDRMTEAIKIQVTEYLFCLQLQKESTVQKPITPNPVEIKSENKPLQPKLQKKAKALKSIHRRKKKSRI